MGIYERKGVRGITYQWKYKNETGTFRTDSKREAETLFILEQTRIDRGIIVAPKPEQSELLSKFIEDFVPERNRSDIAHVYDSILEYFAGCRLDEIKPEHVRAWREHRLTVNVRKQSATATAKKRKPRTVNREFSVLSSVFRRAIEKGKLKSSNPCHGIEGFKFLRKQPQIWTREQAGLAIEYMVGEREHLLPLVIVALQTGLSRKDLFELRVSEVHIGKQTGTICKNRSKTGVPINIPLNQVAIEILSPLIAGKRHNAYVFVNKHTGKPYAHIVKSLDTVCRLAGIPRVTWHTFRHCVGTWLAEDGAGIEVIARFLSHSGYTMAATYVHMAAEKVRPQAEKLGEWVTKPKGNNIVENSSNIVFPKFGRGR